ncbi:MAG: hypothetical protein V2I65_05525 [Paracoccaceae bacterium]|jgi:endonuclease III|nr:hypothetical protein [Paracoccaceae bacterium]
MADTLIDVLIEEQGTLYSEEMGAEPGRDTAQELFHWLVGAIMLSARISAANAVQAARALRAAGLHRIDAIEATDRAELVRVLNENGYARYDESTADYIRDTALWVRERYDGDLRRLRDDGGGADAVLKRLQGAKGLGPLGAHIFAREAQLAWDVFYPTVDGPAVEQARRFGLPEDARALAEMAGDRERFVRLCAALTRVAIDGPTGAVERAAGG